MKILSTDIDAASPSKHRMAGFLALCVLAGADVLRPNFRLAESKELGWVSTLLHVLG